jgi:hypothetical protein
VTFKKGKCGTVTEKDLIEVIESKFVLHWCSDETTRLYIDDEASPICGSG